MANNEGSGDTSQKGGSERGGKGNFANDPQRASEEGKKGGQQSHQGSSDEKSSQQRSSGSGEGTGSNNFADDPVKVGFITERQAPTLGPANTVQ